LDWLAQQLGVAQFRQIGIEAVDAAVLIIDKPSSDSVMPTITFPIKPPILPPAAIIAL
jgi:hypothetical protein